MLPLAAVALVVMAAPAAEDLVKLGESYAARGDAKKAIEKLEKALADPALTVEQRARAEQAWGLSLLQQKKPQSRWHPCRCAGRRSSSWPHWPACLPCTGQPP